MNNSGRWFENLECRKLLSADFGVLVISETLPESLISGAKVSSVVDVRLTNSGEAVQKSDSKIEIRLVLRNEESGIDVLVGKIKPKTYAGLSPDNSINLKGKTTIPTSILPGTYQLLAIADATNAVNERNETNNDSLFAGRVRIDPKIADIGFFSGGIVYYESVYPRTIGHGGVTLTNEGNVKAKGTVSIQIFATPLDDEGEVNLAGEVQVIGSMDKIRVNLAPNERMDISKGFYYIAPENTSDKSNKYQLSTRLIPGDEFHSDLPGNNELIDDEDYSVDPRFRTGGNGVLGKHGLGNKVGFVRTKSLKGNGASGVIAEEGQYQDELGNIGYFEVRIEKRIGEDFPSKGSFDLSYPVIPGGYGGLIPFIARVGSIPALDTIEFFSYRGSLDQKIIVIQTEEAGADGRLGSNLYFRFQ